MGLGRGSQEKGEQGRKKEIGRQGAKPWRPTHRISGVAAGRAALVAHRDHALCNRAEAEPDDGPQH